MKSAESVLNSILRKPKRPNSLFLVLIGLITLYGLLAYQNYGVSWDEPAQRRIGDYTYNYVFKGDQALLTSNDKDYGVAFEFPLRVLEEIFYGESLKDIIEFRHLANFLLFSFSLFIFGKAIYLLTKSYWYSILGVLILVFSPRIFGHAFFNSKDIPFLCGFIWLSYSWLRAFEKRDIKSFVLHGVLTGLVCNLRIMGLMIFVFTIIALVLDWLMSDSTQRKKVLNFVVAYIVTSVLTLYATWPYLWSDFTRIVSIFEAMSKFRWDGFVMFDGQLVKGSEVPWSYIPTWISISTPFVYLVFIAVGVIVIILNAVKDSQLILKNSYIRNQLFFLCCFIAPIFAVIVLNSTLYDGWRQVFFAYVGATMVMIIGVQKVTEWFDYKIILSTFLIQMIIVGMFYSKSFTFEHTYFNLFVSKDAETPIYRRWEVDYWGLSFRQGMKELLALIPEGQKVHVRYNVYPAKINSDTYFPEIFTNNDLHFSRNFTDSTQYVITNYRLEKDDVYKVLEKDFKLLSRVNADNIPLLGIYERRKD